MARPAQKHLTTRELDVMHVYWRHGPQSAAQVRSQLARGGHTLSNVTVANLVRILHEKGFLAPIGDERPCQYQAARTYEEVTGRLLDDVVDKVFAGSASDLVLRLVEQRKLSAKERVALEAILKGGRR